ncbi:hypothetical protein QBC43DRAFT_301358 [Cladorrhinum sp. PSN259]|nr:hypothetical protein QBC43DRAFT_301358 [Cladorrhinum sp. PSN259]
MVHRITMAVNNQSPYYLIPNGQYAYWGETVSGPQTVNPFTNGSGGVFKASAVPWVGSAGVSAYTLSTNNQGTPDVWLVLLGSDPDWSPEDNRARVLMQSTAVFPDKATYNQMFDGKTTVSLPSAHGVFTLTGSIGTEDDCTATFVLTFQQGSGVTKEALEVPKP